MEILVNIDVPDLRAGIAFYERATGLRLERPIETSAWGRLACLGDPFGHGFCFIEWLGRGYAEVAAARRAW